MYIVQCSRKLNNFNISQNSKLNFRQETYENFVGTQDLSFPSPGGDNSHVVSHVSTKIWEIINK